MPGQLFSRPYGTHATPAPAPNVETLGYSHNVPPGQSHPEFPKGIGLSPMKPNLDKIGDAVLALLHLTSFTEGMNYANGTV